MRHRVDISSVREADPQSGPEPRVSLPEDSLDPSGRRGPLQWYHAPTDGWPNFDPACPLCRGSAPREADQHLEKAQQHLEEAAAARDAHRYDSVMLNAKQAGVHAAHLVMLARFGYGPFVRYHLQSVDNLDHALQTRASASSVRVRELRMLLARGQIAKHSSRRATAEEADEAFQQARRVVTWAIKKGASTHAPGSSVPSPSAPPAPQAGPRRATKPTAGPPGSAGRTGRRRPDRRR